jgi:excisionase family DNA binding protein
MVAGTSKHVPLRNERVDVQETNRLAYSVAETARLAGLGRDTVYQAIREGQLIARKCGRRTLINHADLEAFLRSLPPLVLGADNE